MGKAENKKARNKTERRAPASPQGIGIAKTVAKLKSPGAGDLDSALATAEQYDLAGSESLIVDLLKPFESLLDTTQELSYLRYLRLMAIGHAHKGELAEAETLATIGIQAAPVALDFYYILTFVQYSLAEYQDAVDSGGNLLNLLADQSRSRSTLPEYDYSGTRLSQHLNVLACAYRELRQFEPATDLFEKSIKAQVSNQLPYLNYANMLKQLGNLTGCQEIIESGLKKCSQINELRMLNEAFSKRATISACMMVKNEEELLAGSLESIRDWVDEIIVVDTGSTDRTVEIAESYGAKIYHQPWADDFSFHRNYSTSLASCDWILIIDADERIVADDVPTLLEILNDGKHPIVSVNVINVYGEDENRTTFLNSYRLFKRELDLKYEGIVHNVLKFPPDVSVLRTNVRLKHLGYDLSQEKMKKKFERSKALLQTQLDENPDNTFALFNFAQLLLGEGKGNWEEFTPQIVKAASRAVELTDPDLLSERSTHLMCLNQIAYAYSYVRDHEKAIEYSHKALKLKPDYLDPLLLLGHSSAQIDRMEESKKYYNQYLKAQSEFNGATNLDSLILFHPGNRAGALYGLGDNAQRAGEIDSARTYFLQVYELDNGYYDCNSQLGKIYLAEEQFEEAEKYFLAQVDNSFADMASALGLAYINMKRGNLEQFRQYHQMVLHMPPERVHPDTLINLAKSCLQHDRAAEALELLQKASQLGSRPEITQPALAEAYLRLERFEDAAEHYQKILNEGERSGAVLNDLGNCYFNLKQYEQALECYDEVLQSDSAPVATWRNYGLTAAHLGKSVDAAEALEKYLELDPNQHQILRILGDLYGKTGQMERAIRSFERYLAFDSSDVISMFGISEAYHHMGHRDSAILGYQRVVQLDPDFAPAKDRLAELEESAANSKV